MKRPLSLRPYQICSNCIMDTSDPQIKFDTNNVCDHCNNFKDQILPFWNSALRSEANLARIAKKIRKSGRGKEFDCIIGISGGLDSSYVTYVAKEKMGLRPLLFHVDAGWNTDQSVSNIEKLVDGLGLDLYTEVINWEEMKNLQLSFLKSQIPDQDLPQDAAFFSALYKFARKHRIKYVLTGANFSTECCREPEEWGGYLGIDKLLFWDIIRKNGNQNLPSFPIVDIMTYKLVYQMFFGMEIVKPLNLIKYVKNDAEAELALRFGWKKFQHKHHESRFTRFYEDYWLPRKFNYQKRRAHFSSLIMTGQLTREAALNRISMPEMDVQFMEREFEYVAHKLDLNVAELQAIFDAPNKTFHDYKNKRWLIGLFTKILGILGLEKRLFK